MKKLLLFCLLASSALARPFATSDRDYQFAVTGKATGGITKSSGKVLVNIHKGSLIRTSTGMVAGEDRRVIGVRAVLAEPGKDCGWQIVAKSELLPLDKIITPKETISLDGMKFEIPTANLPQGQLDKTWLTFEVVVQARNKETKEFDPGNSGGTTYFHTDKTLRGNPSGW